MDDSMNNEQIPEKSYAWKPPTLDTENEASKSVLEKKLIELDSLSKKWKSRLSEEYTASEDQTDSDRQTLERLRSTLASQFQTMHSALIDTASNQEDIRPRMAPDGGNPPENDT